MTNTATDEQLRDTEGYKLGWMEGMSEGAQLAVEGYKPFAHVRFRAAQRIAIDGNVEANEWYEFCEEHEVGDDNIPAFPVYDHPVSEVAAQAAQLSVPSKDDWAEVVGEVADLYARHLTEKQAIHALRGMDRGTKYYMADAIRWSVAELQRRSKLERKALQANQMVRIFPDELISAASEVAWCVVLPDGRVELDSIFTDFDEANEYLTDEAIAGCSLRGLKFASPTKESK